MHVHYLVLDILLVVITYCINVAYCFSHKLCDTWYWCTELKALLHYVTIEFSKICYFCIECVWVRSYEREHYQVFNITLDIMIDHINTIIFINNYNSHATNFYRRLLSTENHCLTNNIIEWVNCTGSSVVCDCSLWWLQLEYTIGIYTPLYTVKHVV